jgi:CRP/FNR family transcriptional regulator, dissimilatory nitrate respiration regulator
MSDDEPLEPIPSRPETESLRTVFPRATSESIRRLVEVHTLRAIGPGLLEDTRWRGPEILLVLEGHLAVVQRAPDGREAILGVFGPGGIAGLAMIDGEQQTAAFEALDDVVLAVWSTASVREIAKRDPGMLLDIVDLLVTRVRGAMFLLERQTFTTASMRLASALLRNEALAFATARPRFVRSQLAALAGVSREMTGRIMRRWERAGILRRVGPTGLVLVDRSRLEAEAAGAESLAPRSGLPVEMS